MAEVDVDDYYSVLGVPSDASAAEIKSAYRAVVRSAHPDAGGTAQHFQLVHEAYETLSDPLRRARYDRRHESPSLARATATREQRWSRPRRFGDDPDFEAPTPHLDETDIPWWDLVDKGSRVHYAHPGSPGHAPAAGALVGVALLPLPVVMPFAFSVWLFTVWSLVVVSAAATAVLLVRRHLESLRTVRAFRGEFGDRVVFGTPGADDDQRPERLTAELCERYLTRLPGVRVFHGLSWPESVFADIDHAVLCGRRLVLVESKSWLPGHYDVAEDGTVLRNGRRFRGGGTQLPTSLAKFRSLLPDVEVRGALVLYPSREGGLSAADPGEHDLVPVTAEQFVRLLGDWLAAEPATVDRHVFRTVLDHVVSPAA